MGLGTALTSVALKMITQFGRDATLNSTVNAAYNPTAVTKSQTVVQSTIKVFEGTYKSSEIKDGLIELGDAPLYTTSTIDKDDTVEYDGRKYSITHIDSYSVNTDTVLYVANIRAMV